jgi:DNA-binding NarL/FixJ family response regulator
MHRAQIVLLVSEGMTNKDIATKVGATRTLAGR